MPPGEVSTEVDDCGQWKPRSRNWLGVGAGVMWSSSSNSWLVKTAPGAPSGCARFSHVIHEILQAVTQASAIQLAKRSAVVRRMSSIWQPVLRALSKRHAAPLLYSQGRVME